MDVGAVMTEIETPLKTIGLRTAVWGVKTISPPAAIITLPDAVDFHGGYGVGSTRIRDLMVVVLVGRADARSALKTLMPYCAETGTKSVKASLEGYAFTTFDVITVESVEFDTVTYGDVPYLAAMFHTDIVGKGATP